jgi:transposase InsO family protein
MWGTEGTRFLTVQEGWCWICLAVDHFNDEVVGWHVCKRGDRFAALEPIRQGIKVRFGSVGKEVGRGLVMRMDNGPQYLA